MISVNRRGLLIFDVDGTLFQTHLVTVPAVQQSFQRHGLPIPPDREICDLFGRSGGEFRAWLRSLCPEQTVGELGRDIGRIEQEMVHERGRLFPRAREVLTTLRSSAAQMAVCSNGSRAYVEAVLLSQGIDGLFDAVRCRQSDRDSKPLMVAELLDELDARPAIVIGDRDDDVEAAHENGLRAVAATYGYGSEEELASADAEAASALELPDLVATLLRSDPQKSVVA